MGLVKPASEESGKISFSRKDGMDAFPHVFAEFLSESLKFNCPLITESKVDHEVGDCIQNPSAFASSSSNSIA
jgi:hypothetical protein